MNQIHRSSKFDIYLLSRCYRSQSKQCTHYDTLRIPENSTQKEIREAFIKLSKEMHPDIKGNESHAEYVKINEAYNILSKEHLKRVYDSDIKYGHSSDSYSSSSLYPSYTPYTPYKTMRRPSEYEYYRQSSNYTADQWNEYINSQYGDNYYGIKGIRRIKNAWIVFICVSLASIVLIFQIISMNKTLAYNREIVMQRSSLYQLEYKKSQLAAEARSRQEQIQDFEAKIQPQANSRPTGDIN